MRRIIVVGCQGSGKTRLALKLGRKLGLPVVHLDVLYWRPGWKASDKASFRVRVADAIAGEGWVVDGSFSGLAFDLIVASTRTRRTNWSVQHENFLDAGGAATGGQSCIRSWPGAPARCRPRRSR